MSALWKEVEEIVTDGELALLLRARDEARLLTEPFIAVINSESMRQHQTILEQVADLVEKNRIDVEAVIGGLDSMLARVDYAAVHALLEGEAKVNELCRSVLLAQEVGIPSKPDLGQHSKSRSRKDQLAAKERQIVALKRKVARKSELITRLSEELAALKEEIVAARFAEAFEAEPFPPLDSDWFSPN